MIELKTDKNQLFECEHLIPMLFKITGMRLDIYEDEQDIILTLQQVDVSNYKVDSLMDKIAPEANHIINIRINSDFIMDDQEVFVSEIVPDFNSDKYIVEVRIRFRKKIQITYNGKASLTLTSVNITP